MKVEILLKKKFYSEKKWHLWGHRYLTVRVAEAFSRSASEYWKKFYGINFNNHLYNFNDSLTACYFLRVELKKLKRFFLQRIKNYNSISKFYTAAAEKEFHHYLHQAHLSSKGNLKSFTNNQILKRYISFIIAERRAIARFWFIFEIDKIFGDLIKDIARRYSKKIDLPQAEILSTLSQPLKATAVWQEHLDRLLLAERKIKKTFTQTALINHAKKYSWFPIFNLDEKNWTIKDVQNLINKSAKNLILIRQELKNLYSNLKERKEIIVKLKEISLNNANDYKIISWAPEISYYREHRNDIRRQGLFYVKPLYQEIAQRLNISLSELLFLDSNEIIKLLKRGAVDLELLKQRRSGFSCGTIRGKWFILNYPIFKKSKKENKKIKIIRGTSASAGKIIGKVFLILRPEFDLSKFPKDNILVTSMTSPAFVPAIERSKAMITDEGGLTCHAAIIARELKIPCVVGTKIATKLLKNGDNVEVDANNGVVKILH